MSDQFNGLKETTEQRRLKKQANKKVVYIEVYACMHMGKTPSQ